jgi:hypothetical protein
LELYEAARRNGLGRGAFAQADLLQFDLGDKAAALARYRAMLAAGGAPGSSNEMEAAMEQFARAWLAHQIDYLARGTTFSGAVRLDECGAVALALMYGGGISEADALGIDSVRALAGSAYPGGKPVTDAERETLAATLARLPASSITLLKTGNLVALLPNADSILAFLGKSDPAGFTSACYFALFERMGSSRIEAVHQAAQRFNAKHRIVAATPDARFSSPEKTWQLLMDSLRQGDGRTAMSCLTPAMQNKFRALFEGQPPGKLRAMADSFTRFTLSGPAGAGGREAFVNRGEQAGVVYFVDTGGEWKIGEM